ncbi:hypothetical protein [Gimesia aquarii]|uniref:Peptide chain release factor 1 n=1 Tax=Gimesia aquarii TaxID=2527964 RepID=A0A517WX85_9PLAN|nr:hypothetical protein [Gimesia aquarii]QDU09887.1 peptide chain release factor 1 [Gimesia aquarii]
MELKNLNQHIRSLISLSATEAPVISCYQSLVNRRLKDRNIFVERIRTLQHRLSGSEREDFDTALAQIQRYLDTELLPDAQGIAIFCRSGKEPFFLPMQFRVPLPNWIAVDNVPNIYHLIELKDTYHRYIVMIATEESVRILQVNLGSITAQMWNERPELRKRVGREWTKAHFQRYLKERKRKFLKESIALLDKLMVAGDYSHLILAGNTNVVSQIKNELPKHLMERVIDSVTASGSTPLKDVVESTLAAFVEAEEQESRAKVRDLLSQLRTGGLAVAGTGPSYRALCLGQVDVLVLHKDYQPGMVWLCNQCFNLDLDSVQPESCPECGSRTFRKVDIKEKMVSLAEEFDSTIEVVNQSDELVQLGSVGCLLSYRLLDDYI